jgi:lysophospholipase L1-like esterase
MKRLTRLFILSSLFSACAHAAGPVPPIRVILVGDSTMATRCGYGDVLCARFKPGTSCVNLARGGRSSGGFRAEGRWDEVQNLLKDSAGYRASYVLVQFGHNDQPGKPGRSTDLVTAFPANMARYASEVSQLGGVPRPMAACARCWSTISTWTAPPPACASSATTRAAAK